MSLVRREPFHEFTSLQNAINRLFDDAFLFKGLPAAARSGYGGTFPVDIRETAGAIMVRAEIPGMNREDLGITFNDNVLTIKGERKEEEKEEGINFIRTERKYGSFSRSFAMDVPVAAEGIKAAYKDGVLEITLPKKERDLKEITIDVQ
jgi:HSP20 family protein